MKIQGRFIAVLAVLGLLIALLPLAPAGAVTGVVKLTGGEKGLFFSDQTGDNIITIDVTDADLSPTRTGTARSVLTADASDIDLSEFVAAGEKDKIDRLHGGTTNGPCNESQLEGVDNSTPADGVFTQAGDFLPGRLTVNATDDVDPGLVGGGTTGAGARNVVNPRCPDNGKGFALVVTTATGVVDSAYDGTVITTSAVDLNGDGDTADDQESDVPDADYTQRGGNTARSIAYRYTLTETARDRQSGNSPGVGAVTINDIVSVVVNGRAANAAPTTDAGGTTVPGGDPAAVSTVSPWYTVTVLGAPADGTSITAGTEIAGGGITEVIVRGTVAPNSADNSVAVSYKYSEFDFGNATDASATPLNLGSSSVRYAGAGETNYNDATSQVTLASVDDTTLDLNGPANGATLVRFGYDVKDSKKELVTLNSASAGDVQLDTEETRANSNVFQAKVAIFESGELDTIRREALNISSVASVQDNDANGDGTIQVNELNHTNGLYDNTAPNDPSNDRTLDTRVQMAVEAVGLCYTPSGTHDLGEDCDATEDISSAADFLKLTIPARHGDVINVVYADTNPSTRVSKTATVDLEAPVVTLVRPTDKLFTNSSATSFIVDVVDTDSGVPAVGDVGMVPPEIKAQQGGSLALQSDNLIRTPIVDGYRLTVSPAGSIPESKHQWFVAVRDKVGNEPVMDDDSTNANEGARGAAGINATEADNPFEFTVDTRAPELVSGKTGLYLKNPGVTSGAKQETEATNGRTWIRVVFETHTGTAPLDSTSVSADDFRVDGAAPLDAKINSKEFGEAKPGEAVYLEVGQLDTDARPEVQLTGEIRDKAGNVRTEGRLTAIIDGLDPILTVTPSAGLAEKEVTISISSSETLRSNPTLKWTKTKPTMDTFTVDNPSPIPSVSLQTGSLTKWAATFKNVPGQADRWYVAVEGTDLGGNDAEVGIAAKEGDLVTFQVDDANPKLKFVDASGNELKDNKNITEGVVWLVGQFDEDEHADDKSRGVTVTAVILTDKDKDTDAVIKDDPSEVFGSEKDCADHDDVTATDKCAERTLAVELTPGNYNIKMTGVDASGNDVTGNVDFTVKEAAPFDLPLRPGINFISIPGAPMGDGGDINVMLGSHPVTTVSTYDRSLELQGQNPWLRSTKDAETGMFSGDITLIEPGKAYFITATSSSEVKVKIERGGVTELPPTINVRQGYNAIGFWSQSGDASAEIDDYLNSIGWTVAYSYDPTPGKGWTTIRRGQVDSEGDGLLIEEGKGYLVYATYDAVLTP